MLKLQTEVLVIGGGATGTGIVRDLAMRGFKTILVEKGDLTHGTTGRYHGLLHSGGRYVVRDPQAAKECIEENRILRKIMPQCIEDTGGFFVLTEFDDPEYAEKFISGCQNANIPIEEIPIGRMLKEEPLLNPRISRCFRVPDGSADSFLAARVNVESARQYGAQILNYHKVTYLKRVNGKVVGAICHDRVKDQSIEIQADMIVNAAGAWAGQMATMAGLHVNVIPGKGTMLALNHRIVNTVINRCKFPSDGDILVPAHTVAVIGTTDVKVEDPDNFAIEPWEIDLMLNEGEKIVPGFKQLRILRAWAGVRPLYQETFVEDTRDVTRAFVLLDHETRDGVSGFITITGGKWTTYRKMAETTVNLVCQKLGSSRPCRTHLEELPDLNQKMIGSRSKKQGHQKEERFASIERDKNYGNLICECELVTEEEAVRSIVNDSARTLDDIRRASRVGMGPCQGGFCTYRVAGLLHRLSSKPVSETNLALRDFLQERWKGLLPILWGQQLRQERLDELIYLNILNIDHLPGPTSGRLSPELYSPPGSSTTSEEIIDGNNNKTPQVVPASIFSGFQTIHGDKPDSTSDALIIGAGLSGLFTALTASKNGKKVQLISTGWGALFWQTGCVDVLGYDPFDAGNIIESPISALPQIIQNNRSHPYSRIGIDNLELALKDFQILCLEAGYPMHGTLERNWLLPTAVGSLRPTCLAPETMIAGDMHSHDSTLIIGFEAYQDFYPEFIADNLTALGIHASGIRLSLPELMERNFVNSRTLATLFDNDQFCEIVALEIKRRLDYIPEINPKRIGFPAILGLNSPIGAKNVLESFLGIPVYEIPTLPPSIPGIRLSHILQKEIELRGGKVLIGSQASHYQSEDHSITAVWSEAASRQKAHRAKTFVLATGGLLGGGLRTVYDGTICEEVFEIPINAPVDRSQWLYRQFLSQIPHPIYLSGIRSNLDFQPLGVDDQIPFDNLFAVGNGLAGFDGIRERSREGVDLASGYMVGQKI